MVKNKNDKYSDLRLIVYLTHFYKHKQIDNHLFKINNNMLNYSFKIYGPTLF